MSSFLSGKLVNIDIVDSTDLTLFGVLAHFPPKDVSGRGV
jgi:hypothetical protein